MGVSDREYMRNEVGGGGQGGGRMTVRPATPLIKNLVIANIAILLLDYLTESQTRRPIADLFAFSPEHPWEIWRAFTYMFFHENLMHAAFNMMALWFFGVDVQRRLGVKKFIILYVGSGLFGLGGWLAFNWQSSHGLVGASGAVFGVLAAAAVLTPTKKMYIFGVYPMTMRMSALLFLGIEVFRLVIIEGIAQRSNQVAELAHIGGAIGGFGLAWLLGRSSQLKVHRTTRAGRAASTARAPQPQGWPRADPPMEKEDVDAAIDPILDKISNHGEKSLSASERAILERHSLRMAGK